MNLDATIRDVQRALKVAVDGKAGPRTWAAIRARILGDEAAANAPTFAERSVDARSEKVIATLHARVQDYARALVHKAAAQGVTIKVISGTRTYDEQNALYEQGRSKAGRIVTNARGGYSNHNFGIAFDIGVFEGGRYIAESPAYKAVGALGIKLGLEWGGNWKSLRDEPHFQLRPQWADGLSESAMLSGLRARVADGRDAFDV